MAIEAGFAGGAIAVDIGKNPSGVTKNRAADRAS